jgi:hypothetical protein
MHATDSFADHLGRVCAGRCLTAELPWRNDQPSWGAGRSGTAPGRVLCQELRPEEGHHE